MEVLEFYYKSNVFLRPTTLGFFKGKDMFDATLGS